MTVSYELLEEYTGTRSVEISDPDNEGETITQTVDCIDVKVRFTCSETNITHERTVNVCFNEDDGTYDAELTALRMEEFVSAVANKIKYGVLS